MAEAAPFEPLLTARQVAEMLGVHVNTIKRLPEAALPFVRITERGDRRYRPAAVRAYLGEREQQPRDFEALSPREREILRLMPTAGSNQRLANELGISPQTVKNHLASIHRKLGVATTGQAVVLFDRWEHGRTPATVRRDA